MSELISSILSRKTRSASRSLASGAAGLGLVLGALASPSDSFEVRTASAVGRLPASECGEVRLDDVGGAMEHVKVRNQRAIGSCYAHAAAQLYDAWRFRNADMEFEHSSAGFEISQRYKWDREETSVDGGHVKKIIPKLLREGTCSQEELDSLFRGPTLDGFASKVMQIFNKHRAEYHRRMKEALPSQYNFGADLADVARMREQQGFARQDNTRVDRSRVHFDISKVVAQEVLAKGVVELKAYIKDVCVISQAHIPYSKLQPDANTVRMFEMISLAECPEQRRIYAKNEFRINDVSTYTNGKGLVPGVLDEKARFKPEVSLPTIHRELDKGLRRAMPIAVSYCSSILAEGRGFKTKDPNTDDCGRHASLITGRRKNPQSGRCELLIRNTWGNSCGSYSKDWTCDSAKGSVWVDEQVLGRAITNVQTVVPN